MKEERSFTNLNDIGQLMLNDTSSAGVQDRTWCQHISKAYAGPIHKRELSTCMGRHHNICLVLPILVRLLETLERHLLAVDLRGMILNSLDPTCDETVSTSTLRLPSQHA